MEDFTKKQGPKNSIISFSFHLPSELFNGPSSHVGYVFSYALWNYTFIVYLGQVDSGLEPGLLVQIFGYPGTSPKKNTFPETKKRVITKLKLFPVRRAKPLSQKFISPGLDNLPTKTQKLGCTKFQDFRELKKYYVALRYQLGVGNLSNVFTTTIQKPEEIHLMGLFKTFSAVKLTILFENVDKVWNIK